MWSKTDRRPGRPPLAQSTLRFGLIGCGEIGRLRAAALGQTGSSRLVAASDLDPRGAALAARHGADFEADWRALIRRDDLDAVIVSTPPSAHAEQSIAALRAGKHVLCEKPLARTPDECLAVVEAAKRSGCFLATGFNFRFYPSIRKARALLESGLIGELGHLRGYAGYSAREHGQAWVRDSAVVGGGALRDNGIHLIDLCRSFLGEVVEVKGFTSSATWRFPGCEDNGFALLRNPAGTVATLQASWTEWRGYRFVIELYGRRGCIRASCFPMLTHVAWSAEVGGRPSRRVHLFPLANAQEKLRSYRWTVIQSFIGELGAFARALDGQPTPLATGLDGLRAVEIAAAIADP